MTFLDNAVLGDIQVAEHLDQVQYLGKDITARCGYIHEQPIDSHADLAATAGIGLKVHI